MKKGLLVITFAIALQVCSIENWVNCIGNQSCNPCQYCEPKTFEELCASIRDAASLGYKVRAIGNGYSISDVGCTNGWLLNLKHLRQILSVDRETKLVRVEVGVTLQELNEKLADYGLSLSNQAAIAHITLGGALSTGVHGTGHTGTLSSFVREIELISADGNLHKLSQNSDADAFAAASVGLGSLGIIYAVTLQCEPLFCLKEIQETMDIEYVIENYKTLNDNNDFFQFSWNVGTGSVVVNRWNRCEQKTSQNEMFTECVASYRALTWHKIDESDKDLFSEIAVPLSFLPDALRMIKQLVQKYTEAGAKIADITVRFVERDERAYLSPSSNGPVATIAFSILEEDKYLPFYKEFEDVLVAYQGRPHWGKTNFLDCEKAVILYGISLQKFINVKCRLDPENVFSNSFTDRMFNNNPLRVAVSE